MSFLTSLRRSFISGLAGAAIVPFFVPTEIIAGYTGIDLRQNTAVCNTSDGYLGHYNKHNNTITVCVDNYMEQGVARSTVVRHEVIHRVQCNIGTKEVLPKGLLRFIVAQTFNAEEVLEVVLQYPEEEHHGEYEARIFQQLPEGIVSGLLFYSNIYRNIRKSIT